MKLYCIITLTLLLLFSCGKSAEERGMYDKYDSLVDSSKPISFGENSEIYFFADTPNSSVVYGVLDSSLSRTVQLTVEERYFELINSPITEFENLKRYKNLIFCGTLSGRDEVSRHIRSVLDQELQNKVKQSGAELFLVKNHYVRDQLLIYLLADNPERLLLLAELQANQLFDILLERFELRQAYQVYQASVIDKKLFADLPFTIKIPQNYQLYSNDQAGRFLSFVFHGRHPSLDLPDKYVSVYYEEAVQNPVNPEWLQQKRMELANKYFEGDELLPGRQSFEQVKLGDYDALRMRGAWINKDIRGGIGGAFQTYAIWHEATQKVYLIDNIAYFPSGNKLPLLLELGMISASLQIK